MGRLNYKRRSAIVVLCLVAGCSGVQQDDTPPPASINGNTQRNEDDGQAVVPSVATNHPHSQVRQASDSDQNLTGGADDSHPDATKEKHFADWPEPKLVLVVTGRQHGYIEPCGCTGLANQKGGLARRHSFLRQLEARGWQTMAVDVGNQVRRFGPQADLKFQFSVDGLRKMNYRAVAVGPDDLQLDVNELIAQVTSESSPFVSANVSILADDLMPRMRIVEAGGKRIGVTAVLGTEQQQQLTTGDDIKLKPPGEGLQQVWPQLAAKECDLYVLLAHASLEETRALAKQFPKFDLVVTAGGEGEPTFEPEKVEGSDAAVVQVGTKGMYVGAIGVFDDDKQPLRYERVALDASLEDSADMLELLKSYQIALREMGLDKLGAKPIRHPSGTEFVGSSACVDCHQREYDIWKESPHFHATDSIVHPGERSEIPRHFDPECLSCHVTGWNPQKFYPYYSGYLSLEKSPHLRGSGCENCHGPGSRHVAAENGELSVGEDEILKLRAAMRLPLTKAERHCMQCHDLDNSPDFHVEGAFEKYWRQIRH